MGGYVALVMHEHYAFRRVQVLNNLDLYVVPSTLDANAAST